MSSRYFKVFIPRAVAMPRGAALAAAAAVAFAGALSRLWSLRLAAAASPAPGSTA